MVKNEENFPLKDTSRTLGRSEKQNGTERVFIVQNATRYVHIISESQLSNFT